MHKSNTKRDKVTQTSLLDEYPNTNVLIIDAFLSADIPLKKPRHPKIKKLFSNFNIPLPTESTARRKIDELANKKLIEISVKLKDKDVFWLQMRVS